VHHRKSSSVSRFAGKSTVSFGWRTFVPTSHFPFPPHRLRSFRTKTTTVLVYLVSSEHRKVAIRLELMEELEELELSTNHQSTATITATTLTGDAFDGADGSSDGVDYMVRRSFCHDLRNDVSRSFPEPCEKAESMTWIKAFIVLCDNFSIEEIQLGFMFSLFGQATLLCT
jgi:hypothetical protein